MWGSLYVQEKLMQQRLEEFERDACHGPLPEPPPPGWRRLAASLGKTLIRWGTRLQRMAQPDFQPADAARLAGAEE